MSAQLVAWYERLWRACTVQQRWEAFRRFRAANGGSLAIFLAFGPYLRCSWLDVAELAAIEESGAQS